MTTVSESRMATVLCLCAAAGIAALTLYPFDFEPPSRVSAAGLLSSFHSGWSQNNLASDFLANILLFLPFGFGVAAVGRLKGLGESGAALTALIAGFLLSLGVEILQVALADRDSSYSDLLANSLGAGIGAWICRRWSASILPRCSTWTASAMVHRGFLVSLLVLYAALGAAVSWSLARSVHLSNWDASYPLAVGNEATGDRPWKGRVSQLILASRALDKREVVRVFAGESPADLLASSLVAAYGLSGGQDACGATGCADETGQAPPLLRQGLEGQRWLRTRADPRAISEKIAESSEMTLIATVASAGEDQWGPARIVSLSRSPRDRNWTLGQAGVDLVVRLRTPASGRNGSMPAVIVPEVFSDREPHQLIMTYQPPSLSVYVDGIERLHSVGLASTALFRHKDNWDLRMGGITAEVYRWFYYGLLWLPLAGLLWLLWRSS